MVFPDEISIWISGFSKADYPPQCGWSSSNLLRAWIEEKEKEGICSLPDCLSRLLLVFSYPQPRVTPLALWFSELHPGFPTSLACRQQIMGLSLPNCMNQFLVINLIFLIIKSLHVSYWFYFLKNPNTFSFSLSLPLPLSLSFALFTYISILYMMIAFSSF